MATGAIASAAAQLTVTIFIMSLLLTLAVPEWVKGARIFGEDVLDADDLIAAANAIAILFPGLSRRLALRLNCGPPDLT